MGMTPDPPGELLHVDEPEARRIRDAGPGPDDADRLARRFRAFGDPTRLRLALALAPGHELCVCDLSWIAGRSQGLVSHHMRALRAEGLVAARRDGKMVMYSLTGEGIGLVGAAASQLKGAGS